MTDESTIKFDYQDPYSEQFIKDRERFLVLFNDPTVSPEARMEILKREMPITTDDSALTDLYRDSYYAKLGLSLVYNGTISVDSITKCEWEEAFGKTVKIDMQAAINGNRMNKDNVNFRDTVVDF